MESAHTPGPWLAAAGPSSVVGWPVVATPIGRSICNVTWMPGLPPAVEIECKANARLIAAAPDLLEALNALREELSGVDQWWGKLREAADAADAAIAKAQGPQNPGESSREAMQDDAGHRAQLSDGGC